MPTALIVQDNRSLATMAKTLSEHNEEFKTVIAGSRAEVNTLIESDPQRFTTAIVDLNLPDAMHGEVVADLIAANIPVIVMTGAYGEELRERLLGYGVVDYVVKQGATTYQYVCDLVVRIYRNRSIKVLVVDDSPTAVTVLRYKLEIQRFTVLTAGDGVEALEQLRNNPDIRMVFTDYNMPRMDGFKLCQEIRALYGKDQIAIIGLSGNNDNRLASQFLKSGASDYLSKPFSYEELFCRVNQNLELLEHIAAIRDSANRDYLTRLYNRRYFFQQGRSFYESVKDKGSSLAVAMIDIDFFKRVNDSHGHDGGDAALKHIAVLLNSAFADELVARFGGEEFCILLPLDREAAQQSLEAFRQLVENSPVNRDSYHFGFTVSIGFTDTVRETLDEMLAMADTALYQAKESGRNRVVSHTGQAQPSEGHEGMVRQHKRS